MRGERLQAETRQRLSFMVSPELNRAVEVIHEEESVKLGQLNMSPLSKSRTIERLLALGIAAYREQVKRNGGDTGHED